MIGESSSSPSESDISSSVYGWPSTIRCERLVCFVNVVLRQKLWSIVSLVIRDIAGELRPLVAAIRWALVWTFAGMDTTMACKTRRL